jgi:DNA (cytosine-5)-methyltransferase 1
VTEQIEVVDLFCGAGGTSTGALEACKELGIEAKLTAINHWVPAIATHSTNHPKAVHLCQSLEQVNPREVVPGGYLDLLVASPECIWHSNARGGKPINDQRRSSAWQILRWAEALYIKDILIENVKEFRKWGPLDACNKPIKSKAGEIFTAFINALKALDYQVEYDVFNAANYGDRTKRERLLIRARRGGGGITWPAPTHSQAPGPGQKKWRPAAEIIDWSIPNPSIFTRKHPLKPNTLNRIAAGLKKFGGNRLEPFLVTLRNHANPQALTDPLPTITAGGNHIALCEPFIVPQFTQATAKSVNEPLGTITTTSRGIGLCEPILIPVNHGKDDVRAYSLKDPFPTITTVDAWGLVEAFLLQYNGTADVQPLSEPIPTITGKDRFGLVVVDGHRLDIRFRMLQPKELAAATSFPTNYVFKGTRSDSVKQIGNAVPVGLAKAHVKHILLTRGALSAAA